MSIVISKLLILYWSKRENSEICFFIIKPIEEYIDRWSSMSIRDQMTAMQRRFIISTREEEKKSRVDRRKLSLYNYAYICIYFHTLTMSMYVGGNDIETCASDIQNGN